MSTIIVVLLYGKAFCQEKNEDLHFLMNTIPKEKVFVNTNSNILLAGEDLYYKFYCLFESNDNLSTISKIGYVDLISENNIVLFSHKLKLENGVSSGDFFIPSSSITGNYKLIAYTKWMHNNSTNPFFEKDIYIINPYIRIAETLDTQSTANNSVTISLKEDKKMLQSESAIELAVNSKTYKKRSKVSLVLENIFEDLDYGKYSLSVKKKDPIEAIKNENNSNESIFDSKKKSYLPEIRGEIISGRLVSSNSNTDVTNKIIALSMAGTDFVFKNVKTNSLGNFSFNLYEDYNGNELVMQVVSSDKKDYKIILDTNNDYFEQLRFSNVILDKKVNDWLLEHSIQNQIEAAYYYTKKDSIVRVKPSKAFYDLPSVVYVLDDYKRFKTIKETFVEVIEEAALRTNGSQFEFMVYDYEEARSNSFKDRKPLVLFDGVFIQHNENVVDYNAHDIETISVVRGIYFYGPSIFNGIIDIKTKKGDFNLKNEEHITYFNYVTPLNNKKYYSPNYDKYLHELSKIPDYRNQLLWIPNMSLNSNSKVIDFYTSDVDGMFEIVLEGFTSNGEYINLTHKIEVKKE